MYSPLSTMSGRWAASSRPTLINKMIAYLGDQCANVPMPMCHQPSCALFQVIEQTFAHERVLVQVDQMRQLFGRENAQGRPVGGSGQAQVTKFFHPDFPANVNIFWRSDIYNSCSLQRLRFAQLVLPGFIEFGYEFLGSLQLL